MTKGISPAQMYAEALKHNGRYLLPMRFGLGNLDKDRLYDAAEWLINNSYACWIRGNSAPGIELTGKPFANGEQPRTFNKDTA
jgi:hypothetical protein